MKNSAKVEQKKPVDIYLRQANSEDMLFLFDLANDPSSRANSFSTQPISLEEHERWFASKLAEPNSYIFIAEKDSAPVGQIRIDIESDYGKISFSVAQSARGQSMGTHILKRAIAKFLDGNFCVSRIVGFVKRENLASQKAFLNADFIQTEQLDCLAFWYPDAPETTEES